MLGLAALSNRPAQKIANSNEAALQSLLAAYGADNVTLDRNAREYKLPKDIEWKSRPQGGQTAIVFGDPAKPGLVVQLLKRGPDDWAQPHSHSQERFIRVLQGTMLIGTGSKFDKANTVAIGVGGMIRDVANQTHYDGTGPEGMTIEIIAMGPITRN